MLQASGDLAGAVALYDQALEICERLVHQEGRSELRGDLAWVQAYKASVLLSLGDRNAAASIASEAMEVLEEEVQRTGRRISNRY